MKIIIKNLCAWKYFKRTIRILFRKLRPKNKLFQLKTEPTHDLSNAINKLFLIFDLVLWKMFGLSKCGIIFNQPLAVIRTSLYTIPNCDLCTMKNLNRIDSFAPITPAEYNIRTSRFRTRRKKILNTSSLPLPPTEN